MHIGGSPHTKECLPSRATQAQRCTRVIPLSNRGAMALNSWSWMILLDIIGLVGTQIYIKSPLPYLNELLNKIMTK